jgi:hypothetical protein
VAQAFNGMTYIENVFVNYVTEFVTKFNPNLKSSWFTPAAMGSKSFRPWRPMSRSDRRNAVDCASAHAVCGMRLRH